MDVNLASLFSCLCLYEHDFNPQFKGVLINPGCHIYIDIGFKKSDLLYFPHFESL